MRLRPHQLLLNPGKVFSDPASLRRSWGRCTSITASCPIRSCRASDGRDRDRDPPAPTSWPRAVSDALTHGRASWRSPAAAPRRRSAPMRQAGHPRHERLSDRVIDYDPPELVLTAGAGDAARRHPGAGRRRRGRARVRAASTTAHLRRSARQDHASAASSRSGVPDRAESRRATRATTCSVSRPSPAAASVSWPAARWSKNVTGYDLPKLMRVGGQLAVLTQLTLKVLPRPRPRAHARCCGLE